MSEPFIGQIMLVPYNFAPRGWAFCQGQLMPVQQNTALFSLLGTTYGGNGQQTFGLPDLRGRVAIGAGQGPGLGFYQLGEVSGSESVTLLANQMPIHNHLISAVDDDPNSGTPNNSYLANTNPSTYSTAAPSTAMSPNMVSPAGGNQSHPNLQPYLTLNYIIALNGIFPSRN